MAAKHKGLGRGLSALIKDQAPPDNASRLTSDVKAEPNNAPNGATRIPVNAIHKSPWQPRRHFEPAALADLVASIREHGVLQPVLVRKIGDGYQLMAGERRFRAAQEAELADIPALVMEADDQKAVEITLIENLQREDLDPIEEAEGYHSLADQFHLTQDDIATRVGKSRAAIANALRLLSLPDSVRSMISNGNLSVGHAKVLLGLTIPEEQELLAARVAKESLSVRALERVVADQGKPPRKAARTFHADIPATHVQHLSEQLHQRLGTSVRLTSSRTLPNGKKAPGRIEIDYYSADDLDRLLIMLGISDNF
jgi:ParB family transcriptional regulator, chromosome partitioning protein